jgi:RNA polymerase sigma factor (sigma-70 family)
MEDIRMDANALCYLWDRGRRVEITYAELRKRQQTDAAFRKRRFWFFDDALIEVTEDEYRKLRREARHHAYLHEFEKEVDIVPLSDLPDEPSQGSFEQKVLESILGEDILQALHKLPQEDTQLIRSIFFEGKTEREIAVLLGISPGAVNKRKARILAQLREMLGEN